MNRRNGKFWLKHFSSPKARHIRVFTRLIFISSCWAGLERPNLNSELFVQLFTAQVERSVNELDKAFVVKQNASNYSCRHC